MFITERCDNRACYLPFVNTFYFAPYVFIVRGIFWSFCLEGFDVAVHLIDVQLRVCLRVCGRQYSKLKYAGTFQHSLQVPRVVESSLERPILVKGRDHTVYLFCSVRELSFELVDGIVAFDCFFRHCEDGCYAVFGEV